MSTPDQQKPIIGISGMNSESKSVRAIIRAVEAAGGTPLILENHGQRNAKLDADNIHALIIAGNNHDVRPEDYISRYPEGDPRRNVVHPATNSTDSDPAACARAKFENELLDAMAEKNKSVLGICGGEQLMNVHFGGTLIQNLADKLGGNDRHSSNGGNSIIDSDGKINASPVFPISIIPDSALAKIGGDTTKIYIPGILPDGVEKPANTVVEFCHQHVENLAPGFKVTATSEGVMDKDGKPVTLIEAIEGRDGKFIGVQWHPELQPDSPLSAKLFGHVVQEAQKTQNLNKKPEPYKFINQLLENVISSINMGAMDYHKNLPPTVNIPGNSGRSVV